MFTCKLHWEAEVSYRLIASRAFTADLLTWFVKFAKYMVRRMPQQSENKTGKVKFCIECPKWHSGTKNTLVWGYRDKKCPYFTSLIYIYIVFLQPSSTSKAQQQRWAFLPVRPKFGLSVSSIDNKETENCPLQECSIKFCELLKGWFLSTEVRC